MYFAILSMQKRKVQTSAPYLHMLINLVRKYLTGHYCNKMIFERDDIMQAQTLNNSFIERKEASVALGSFLEQKKIEQVDVVQVQALNNNFIERKEAGDSFTFTEYLFYLSLELEADYVPQTHLPVSFNKRIFLSIKRCFDIVFSLVGILLLLPLFPILGLVIVLESRGPILFSQRRLGKDGKPFIMYKFRSMSEDAEKIKQDIVHKNEVNGPMFKVKDDPRHTKFGTFMRRYKLDELPQLWNVFRGEMSIVGPRPLEKEEMFGHFKWTESRLSVRQGLTGLWQTDNKNYRFFEEWVYHDTEYVNNQSLWLDFKIMLKTPFALFIPK